MFVLINGVQTNALLFGKEVIVAGSPSNAPINHNLQKFLAVVITTFVCQLQAYSRFLYVRIGNTLAMLKVAALLFIAICGLAALGKAGGAGAHELHTAYGKANLNDAFASRSSNPYQYSIALLNVMRAFLGYENANFVRTLIDIRLHSPNYFFVLPGFDGGPGWA
jgi:L-asparagine transporter-like permease